MEKMHENKCVQNFDAVIIGRDLSSHMTALILHRHGYKVALVSEMKSKIMEDLREYISLNCLYEAARRCQIIHSLSTKGLNFNGNESINDFNWRNLTDRYHQIFMENRERIEKAIAVNDISLYEGILVMIEDDILRVVSDGRSIKTASHSFYFFSSKTLRSSISICCSKNG